MFTDLSEYFYLADLSKVYFIPYCDGELLGMKHCENCTKKQCKGFWGGGERIEKDQPTEGVIDCESREDRVAALALAYTLCDSSPLDILPIPDPRTMLRPDQLSQFNQYGGKRNNPTTLLGGERVDWDS